MTKTGYNIQSNIGKWGWGGRGGVWAETSKPQNGHFIKPQLTKEIFSVP